MTICIKTEYFLYIFIISIDLPLIVDIYLKIVMINHIINCLLSLQNHA